MRLSHADFRPGKRPRYVPSGPPRRKIPLLRIALLVAGGVFVYANFDAYWPRVRDAMNPAALWNGIVSGEPPHTETPRPAWSRDSSRVVLNCPQGLTPACCARFDAVSPALCAEASALLTRARWKRLLGSGSNGGSGGAARAALSLEARAVVSDLGDWSFELSGLKGRDAAGAYAWRRAAGTSSWCDERRGCLRDPAPRPPLAGGRLRERDGVALWIAAEPRVRAALAGRVTAVDSAPGGAVVRVHHGRELYAAYGPLQPAPGVEPGALVKAGSHLGFAPRHAQGYGLAVRLRRTGRPLDAAAFWGIAPQADEASEAVLLSGVTSPAPDGGVAR